MEEVDGPGVIGLYPEVTKESGIFTYESCCPTHILGTEMSGYFTFRWLDGPNAWKTFNATIDPIILNVEEGTEIVNNPLWDPNSLY